MTTDLHTTAPIVQWPASVDTPPPGWRWGRHVSLGPLGSGSYLIRDADGALVIARMRPDLRVADVPQLARRPR